jgi:uncharacterized protein YegP (UPF0339 family)
MKLTAYKSTTGWRWQIKARNGKIVGASSEGFTTLRKCRENMNLVYLALLGSPVKYNANTGCDESLFMNESDLKPKPKTKG